MKMRSWIILLGITVVALVSLTPLFTRGEYHALFCETFSDINAMPYHQSMCAAFERVHVCRGVERQSSFYCEVFK